MSQPTSPVRDALVPARHSSLCPSPVLSLGILCATLGSWSSLLCLFITYILISSLTSSESCHALGVWKLVVANEVNDQLRLIQSYLVQPLSDL
jgi:hypothetical protein